MDSDNLPGRPLEFWHFIVIAVAVILIAVVAIWASERQAPYVDVVVNGTFIDRIEYPDADSAQAQEVLSNCGDMVLCFPVHVWYPDGLQVDTVRVDLAANTRTVM